MKTILGKLFNAIFELGTIIENSFGKITAVVYLVTVISLIVTVCLSIIVGIFVGMIDGSGPFVFGSNYIGFIK